MKIPNSPYSEKKINNSSYSDSIIQIKIYRKEDFSDLSFCSDKCVLIYANGIAGKKVVGKAITDINDDELILSGPHLPTLFVNIDSETKMLPQGELVIVSFNPITLLHNFSGLINTQALESFLKRAQHGIQFTGITRDKIVEFLTDIENRHDVERIIILFKIINEFTTCAQYQCFNQSEDKLVISKNDFKILVKFFNFAFKYYSNIPAISPIDRTVLRRLLRKHYGCSIYQFINRLKVYHACSLLVGSEMSVKAVADASGFESATKFCKVFKQQIGVTAKNFRLRKK